MRRRPNVARLRDQSFNRLIPNILTLLALCAGLTGIRFGLQERWEAAVAAIVIAAILDGLDGRIARLLDSTSKFGAELDSLSDFVSFGVAPAMLLYFWNLSETGAPGWAAVLLYCVCCGLRLARFNTKLDNADLPAWTGRFFMGVPAPAAAGLVLTPMIAALAFGPSWFDTPWLSGLAAVVVAGLMVSRLPTYSFKRIKVPQHYVLPTLLGVGALAAFLASSPWLTMLGIAALYLATLPMSWLAYRRLSGGAAAAGPLPGPADEAEIDEPDELTPH
ncbi:MAG: CDP-diacylglycerol--serine O-phosphatidyltransferase [Pseudomonadota bacterium]